MTHFARHTGLRLVFTICIATLAAPAFANDMPALVAGATAGDAQAQLQLGNAYLNGEGVAADRTQGLKLCREAADQGYAPAQAQLALKYASGHGVPVDRIEADKWMVLAVTADANYASVRNMVEARLTRDEVRQGRAAAAQWLVDHAGPQTTSVSLKHAASVGLVQ